MLQTRSSILLVAVTNTAAGGGSAVVITNSSNLFITNTAFNVNVMNSANWVVYVANTVAGGNAVTITNSGGLFAQQSGPWTVAVSNTGGSVIVSNTQTAINIINSAGWIMAQSNTSPLVQVQNSAGWVMAQSNTSPLVQVQNSAGWIVNVANTGGPVTILNSSRLATTYDTSYVMDGASQIAMQYGSVNVTNSTNTVIVNSVANLRIRVTSVFVMSQGTGLLTWQSGTNGTGLTGAVLLATNVGYVLPFHPNGWFQTGTNTQLNLNLSTPTSIGGCITYITTS